MAKPSWFRRPVHKPLTEFDREAVKHAQRVLGLRETGEMDEATMSHLRGVQALFNLNRSGLLDEETAEQLDRIWPDGA